MNAANEVVTGNSKATSYPVALTAAILAGGLGTRLRSVVGNRPKVLASVEDRPYLTYLLDVLDGAGFREVLLLTGYHADQVASALGNSYRGLRLIYSPEPSPLGTGGAVRLALPLMASPDILLMNGDSFCEVDLTDLQDIHNRQAADLTLVVTEVADVSRYGQVRLAPDGRVLEFGEKARGQRRGLVNAGIYLLQRRLLETIPTGRSVSLERDLLPAWLKKGKRVLGYHSAGRFIDIGTPDSYAEAQAFFHRRSGVPPLSIPEKSIPPLALNRRSGVPPLFFPEKSNSPNAVNRRSGVPPLASPEKCVSPVPVPEKCVSPLILPEKRRDAASTTMGLLGGNGEGVEPLVGPTMEGI